MFSFTCYKEEKRRKSSCYLGLKLKLREYLLSFISKNKKKVTIVAD